MSLTNKSSLFLLLILLLGLALRLYTLGNYATWHDERLSINTANSLINLELENSFTLREIKNHDNLNNVFESNLNADASNGILYATVLYFWKGGFGNSDFSMRFPSVLFGLLVIYSIYSLTFYLTKNNFIALTAALIAAIHPFLIHYSQEARSYNLCLLFTILSTQIFFKILDNKYFSFKKCIAYSLISAAAILSHFFAIYILLAHAFMLITKRHGNHKWKSIIASGSLIGIFLIPWLVSYGMDGVALINERNMEYAELSRNDPDHIFYTKTGFFSIATGWAQNLLNFTGNSLGSIGIQIRYNAISLVAAFMLLYPLVKYYIKGKQGFISQLIILTASFLFFATLLAIKSNHVISFQINYGLFSIPYFISIISLSIHYMSLTSHRLIKNVAKLGLFVQVAIVIISVSLIYKGLDSHEHGRNIFAQAAEKINTMPIESSKNNYVLLHSSSDNAKEINKYLEKHLLDLKQEIKDSIDTKSLYLYNSNTKSALEINL